MANISAALIKELRERTGVGFMACREALTEAEGDLDRAVEILRVRGIATAAKKGGRAATEGLIVLAEQSTGKLLLEVNCETDFVANTEDFRQFAEQVADAALAANCEDAEKIAELTLESGKSVADARQDIVQKIGENVTIRRACLWPAGDGTQASYVHRGRIGVLVELSGGTPELGRDLAMHIAASQPLSITEDQLPADLIEQERRIYTEQAAQSDKPAEVIEKMIDGQVRKFIKTNTLLHQPFVKEPKQSVEDLLKSHKAGVRRMQRIALGEGLEKKAEDFAAEVAGLTGSA